MYHVNVGDSRLVIALHNKQN